MKKILIILFTFLFFPVFSNDDNYYVDNTGTGDTLATIAELIAVNLNPDDTVFFKRGCSWRESYYENTDESGSSGHPVVYTCYGTGAKPLFMYSKNESSTGDWTNITGNIWQNSDATFTVDVGNLVFNGGSSIGVKKQTVGALASQGDFWYDFANDRIRIYSVGNPASFYTDIECCLKGNIFESHNNSYAVFDSLEFKYSGGHGIGGYECDYITVKHCDFSHIGGGDLYGDYGTRYGNAVEFYGGCSNIEVYGCTIDEIYDTGITTQAWENGLTITNIKFHHNIIKNCHWTTELFAHGSGCTVNNIYFENNTCINAGGQMSQDQRWNGRLASHVMLWGYQEAATGIYIRNNIFRQETGVNNQSDAGWWCISMYSDYDVFTIDYNLFDLDLDDYMWTGVYPVYQDGKTLANWQSISGQDAHSVDGSADFTTEFTDLTLQATSDAIDVGIGAGYVHDFRDSLIGEDPDIGAYEYNPDDYDPPPTAPTITTTTPTIIYTRLVRAGGSSIDAGGGTITAKGYCWSTSANPTTSSSKVSGGTGTDAFSGYITGLKANTTYHVRAYATNATATSYGADIEFTTPVHSTGKTGGKYLKTGNKIVILH